MDLDNIITRDKLISDYVDPYFKHLFNHIDENILNKIRNIFYECATWYKVNCDNNYEEFIYRFLAYLLFLYDNNLLESFTFISFKNALLYEPNVYVLDYHYLLTYPKHYHDHKINDYYKELSIGFRTFPSYGMKYKPFENYKYKEIHNICSGIIENLSTDNWITYMACYLYQCDNYEEVFPIMEHIANNKEEYYEFLDVYGMNNELPFDKVELILESYIKYKLGFEKKKK